MIERFDEEKINQESSLRQKTDIITIIDEENEVRQEDSLG